MRPVKFDHTLRSSSLSYCELVFEIMNPIMGMLGMMVLFVFSRIFVFSELLYSSIRYIAKVNLSQNNLVYKIVCRWIFQFTMRMYCITVKPGYYFLKTICRTTQRRSKNRLKLPYTFRGVSRPSDVALPL